jgi:hypothetical protein
VEQAAAQGDAGVSWSDGQLRILRAMGHEPFVRVPVGAAFGRDSNIPEQPSRRTAAPTIQSDTAALAAAIARAAGGRDLASLALDLERLRGEPALKRALWPQLRRLRRGH